MDTPPPDLRAIFAGALERPEGPERDAYLDEACRGDASLRADVEDLLRAHDGAGDFLAAPPTAEAGPPPPTEGVGERIGPYKLLQQIGEGGMGAVFMAEQERPVRRRVALKVIKAGMDSAQVIARFEAERQALALMDHPNIARVLDAGTTDAGRPYFVMELVKGIPITEYCDEARLSPRERLELFIPVCQAIQHAHQKGVIHRDIKPTNVLVTLVDGAPVPKVIDFGVAKAVEQRLTERTLFTQFGAIVGTPEYMSPEQAGISAADVDTRSDIYSLGVLLYELLTGSTPLDRDSLRQAAFAEIMRRIREEEPQKPSTRLSGSRDKLASLSAVRQTEPSRLTRLMRGDLDWIVMRALEKGRSRRYETAAGFARDVRRYLDGDAVEAGPPSARYRLGKFARKNRAALATAAAFALLLVAATAVSGLLAVRASRARGESERSRKEAEAVSEFLVSAFKSPDPNADGAKLRVVEVLDRAEKELEADAKMSPTIKGKLLHVLGVTYRGLGQWIKSNGALERAKVLRSDVLGPIHRDTLESRAELVLSKSLAGDALEAVALGRAVLRDCESALEPWDRITLRARNTLGSALWWSNRMAEAIPLAEGSMRLCEGHHPEDSEITTTCRLLLHEAYFAAGRRADAVAQLQRCLESFERTKGRDHPATVSLRNQIKHQNAILGKGGMVTREEREAAIKRSVEGLPPEDSRAVIGRALLAVERYNATGEGDVLAALDALIAADRAEIGVDRAATLDWEKQRGMVLLDQGRYAEGIAALEDVVARLTKRPSGPEALLLASNALALAYLDHNRRSDAIRVVQGQVEALRKARGRDDLATLEEELMLADYYLIEGRPAEARPIITRVLAICERSLGERSGMTRSARLEHVMLLLAEGRPAEAASAQEAVIKVAETCALPTQDLAWLHMHLGHLYFESGNPEKAEAEWNVWVARIVLKNNLEFMEMLGTGSRRGEMPLRRREFAEAEKWIVPNYEFMKRRELDIGPMYKPRLIKAGERVVRLYEAWGNQETAAKWRDRIGKTPPGPAEAPGTPPRRPTEVRPSPPQPAATPPRAASR